MDGMLFGSAHARASSVRDSASETVSSPERSLGRRVAPLRHALGGDVLAMGVAPARALKPVDRELFELSFVDHFPPRSAPCSLSARIPVSPQVPVAMKYENALFSVGYETTRSDVRVSMK